MIPRWDFIPGLTNRLLEGDFDVGVRGRGSVVVRCCYEELRNGDCMETFGGRYKATANEDCSKMRRLRLPYSDL
jgi:hypothetical protein